MVLVRTNLAQLINNLLCTLRSESMYLLLLVLIIVYTRRDLRTFDRLTKGLKSSGFRVGDPKKPETRCSGSGRVGLGFFWIRVFRVGDPRGVKNSGRVEFQKFGFFGHPSNQM